MGEPVEGPWRSGLVGENPTSDEEENGPDGHYKRVNADAGNGPGKGLQRPPQIEVRSANGPGGSANSHPGPSRRDRP